MLRTAASRAAFLSESSASTVLESWSDPISVGLDGRRGVLRTDAIIPDEIFFSPKFGNGLNEFILVLLLQSEHGNPFKSPENPNHHQIQSL